jgi:putative ABC transport system permease protein
MDTLVRDLRYALRQLRLSPGYAVLAIVSIGIGIGATTTIFSLVEALLIRNVPAPRADRLVYAYESRAAGSGFHSFSFLQYKDLRDRSRALTDLAAFDINPLSVATTGDAAIAAGFNVSGNFFKVFGATPALGRFFLPEEDAYPDIGSHPVAVVSHAFWERRLGGDTSAVGRTIRVNGRAFTVVGVARPEMSSLVSFIRPDVWTPIAMSNVTKPGLRLDSRENNTFQVVGRLADGATRESAERELEAIARQIEDDHPELVKGRGVDLYSYFGMPPEARKAVAIFMALLMSFSLLILLVACGNLAGVIMARGVQRQRELAVRVALGASRSTVVRQLVTETVVLFLAGCVLAIGIAEVATHAMIAFKPPIDVPIEFDIRVDGRVIAFALVVAFVVGALFALLPALRSTRLGVMSVLKSEGRTSSGQSRGRNIVVAAQLAFTLLLLVDAALVTRALGSALNVNPGFDMRNMRVVTTNLQMRNYRSDAGRRLLDQWRSALLAHPGVSAVAFTSRPPLGTGNSTIGFQASGDARDRMSADVATVSNDYFGVMEIPLIAGRAFASSDREGGQQVAIVSAELARRVYGSPAQAIGRMLLAGSNPNDGYAIVGVAADTKVRSLAESPRFTVYLAIGQSHVAEISALIRGDVTAAASAGRTTLRALDPDLPLMNNTTFEQYTSVALLPQRLAGVVSATLGIIGLLLAAIGVYGIVAYAVSQRTREIGIRVAVGATPNGVARFMAGEGIRVAAIGVVIGLALSLGGAQLIRSFLLGMNPYDPLAFGSAAFGLLAVAIVACLVPARRAAKVDPIVALRAE